MFELTAKTEAGAYLVRVAEVLAEDLAGRAAAHDREASFPHAGIAALKGARYFTAPIPTDRGGLGVTSLHDLVVASSRLARGDASVTIGVNMHLIVLLNLVRRWQAAVSAGNQRRAAAFGASIDAVARDGAVIAAAVSEPGQDLTRPGTQAVRTLSGWRIDGRKAFCTLSPAATVLYASVTFVDDDGIERYGYAQVPTATAGVVIHDDWDALGMRASGSHSVSFDGVELPPAALRGGFVTGDASAYMERNLTNGLFHAAASLGIAESAASTAVDGLRAGNGFTRAHPDRRERHRAGAARATLSRATSLADDPVEDVVSLFAQIQAAKTFVNEAAARIVDRALALSGGAGYASGHPLARAYRDVRAGGFMHPLGANRAYDFVSDVALGRDPVLH